MVLWRWLNYVSKYYLSLHRAYYMNIKLVITTTPTLSRGRKALAVIGTAVAYVGVITRRQKAVVRCDTTDSHAASASYRQQYGFYTSTWPDIVLLTSLLKIAFHVSRTTFIVTEFLLINWNRNKAVYRIQKEFKFRKTGG